MGAMVPYFEGRRAAGSTSSAPGPTTPTTWPRAPADAAPVDYFRMFYGDTALFGAAHAMECGLAFFGADRVLFGTDMPFDPEKGPGFIRETIAAMERMRATPRRRRGSTRATRAARVLRLHDPVRDGLAVLTQRALGV